MVFCIVQYAFYDYPFLLVRAGISRNGFCSDCQFFLSLKLKKRSMDMLI